VAGRESRGARSWRWGKGGVGGAGKKEGEWVLKPVKACGGVTRQK